jgi:hypothetical protein
LRIEFSLVALVLRLAFLMSPMIVLRMKVRRFGEVVIASRRGASTGKDGKVVGGREAMWAVKVATELWRKNAWP